MGRISILVILLFGLTAGIASRYLPFDDDEFQHAHMAWLLARGEVPHRDFFEHHLPLYHFLTAPFTLGSPGPERILYLRGFSVLIAMATLVCLTSAIKKWTENENPGVLALVAFSPIFFIKMIEVRPEGFCLLLACAALALLKSPRRLLLAGLLGGAMVIGSQKFVFLAAGLFLIAWREHGFRQLKGFCIGGALVPLLTGFYYLFTGSLPQAYQDLVVMNLGWKESFSPSMYAVVFWSSSALLIVSGLFGIKNNAVFWMLISGLAAVWMVPIPFRQTFLMLYPGLALGSVRSWQLLAPVFTSPKQKITAGCCLTFFALLPAIENLKSEFQTGPGEDLTMMRTVEIRGSGPVFDGRRLLFYRDHVGHYPWMHQGLMQMLDPEDHARKTIGALTEAEYPDVLWDYRVEMMSPSLHRFLQENYVPLTPAPLWVPGKQIDRSILRAGTEITLPVEGTYRVSWQGGSAFINDREVRPEQLLKLGTQAIQIRGNGFIRGFKIHRAGAAE